MTSKQFEAVQDFLYYLRANDMVIGERYPVGEHEYIVETDRTDGSILSEFFDVDAYWVDDEEAK